MMAPGRSGDAALAGAIRYSHSVHATPVVAASGGSRIWQAPRRFALADPRNHDMWPGRVTHRGCGIGDSRLPVAPRRAANSPRPTGPSHYVGAYAMALLGPSVTAAGCGAAACHSRGPPRHGVSARETRAEVLPATCADSPFCSRWTRPLTTTLWNLTAGNAHHGGSCAPGWAGRAQAIWNGRRLSATILILAHGPRPAAETSVPSALSR